MTDYQIAGVARLTIVYYRNQPNLSHTEDITEQPLILNTDASFPFKTFTINSTNIKPTNPVCLTHQFFYCNFSLEFPEIFGQIYIAIID